MGLLQHTLAFCSNQAHYVISLRSSCYQSDDIINTLRHNGKWLHMIVIVGIIILSQRIKIFIPDNTYSQYIRLWLYVIK